MVQKRIYIITVYSIILDVTGERNGVYIFTFYNLLNYLKNIVKCFQHGYSFVNTFQFYQ